MYCILYVYSHISRCINLRDETETHDCNLIWSIVCKIECTFQLILSFPHIVEYNLSSYHGQVAGNCITHKVHVLRYVN